MLLLRFVLLLLQSRGPIVGRGDLTMQVLLLLLRRLEEGLLQLFQERYRFVELVVDAA